VGDRSTTSAADALGDGIARVLAAPVILLGTIGVVILYGMPGDARHLFGAWLLWAFLSGGILDRYARRRPTRGRGFFAACGAHLGAMFRLGLSVLLVVGLFHLVMGSGFPNGAAHQAAFIAALAMTLVLTLAQVRVAVEDRRSAIGALLGAVRFAARNPASVALFAAFVPALLAVMLINERTVPGNLGDSAAWATDKAFVAIECFLVLTWYAVATALFQSRLAHAGYTAAPPLVWPESPAAEAIDNLPPAGTP
jgi:hypothetical protein